MSVGVIVGCLNVPNAPLYRLELLYNGKCQSVSLGDVLETYGPSGPRHVYMKVTGWHQIGAYTHPEVQVVYGSMVYVVPGDDLRHVQQTVSQQPAMASVPVNGFTYGSPRVPQMYHMPFPMSPAFDNLTWAAAPSASCECGAEKALNAKPGQPGHSSWCPAK